MAKRMSFVSFNVQQVLNINIKSIFNIIIFVINAIQLSSLIKHLNNFMMIRVTGIKPVKNDNIIYVRINTLRSVQHLCIMPILKCRFPKRLSRISVLSVYYGQDLSITLRLSANFHCNISASRKVSFPCSSVKDQCSICVLCQGRQQIDVFGILCRHVFCYHILLTKGDASSNPTKQHIISFNKIF